MAHPSKKLHRQKRSILDLSWDFFTLLNTLSIDVAFGAVSISYMISRFMNAVLPQIWWLLLMLSVWVIYTFDHLADSKKASTNILAYRHRFHKRHFNMLLSIGILWVVMIIPLGIMFLPWDMLRTGWLIGCICMLYLLYSYFFKKYLLPKEILVAILYLCGVSFGSLLLKPILSLAQVLFFVTLFSLILNNLLVFSFIEKEADTLSSFSSFSIHYGAKKTHVIIYILLALSLIAPMLMFVLDRTKWLYVFVLILMDVVLYYIMLKKDALILKERYRILGDGIFLIPLILIGG